jgi:uncharacterized protein YyaL (SSP411 family)
MRRTSFVWLASALTVVVLVAVGAKLLKRYEVEGRTNALAQSPSTYLYAARYQHIDWLEWGDEAFEKAARLGRPIFVDLGVFWDQTAALMNQDNFSDPTVDLYLNDNFVCVKVDAEQRPDVAAALLVQNASLEGAEGWPVIGVATPEGVLYGVTGYRAPEVRGGFYDFVRDAHEVWLRQGARLREEAEAAGERLRERIAAQEQRPERPGPDLTAAFATALYERYDAQYGGFVAEDQPGKRIDAPALLFLLERAERGADPRAGEVLERSLDALMDSALNDPVFGGFHLAATDRQWRSPIFGKYLVSNVLLLELYARAYELFGNEAYRRTAVSIGRYVRTELWDAEDSVFFTARSGAKKLEEPGAYYVWSLSQLQKVCNPLERTAVALRYGVAGRSNVQWDRTRHILRVVRSIQQLAERMNVSTTEAESLVADGLAKMAADESRRGMAPPNDKGTYTDLNGLAAYCFAAAARELRSYDLAVAARQAVDRIVDLERDADGLLPHGSGGPSGLLGDQVWAARAALALYGLTRTQAYLDFAKEVAGSLGERFEDRYGTWGMWQRAEDRRRDDADRAARAAGRPADTRFLIRGMLPLKPIDDGFGPSANAAAALLFLDLYEATGEAAYRDAAWRILYAFGGAVRDGGPAQAGLALAMDRYLALPSPEGQR